MRRLPLGPRLRIGVIELLTDTRSSGWVEHAYGYWLTKQFASITPQAAAIWCRELGHQVHYTTYYGQADPRTLLPGDLDVLFVSAYTRSSGLAYALAKVFRRTGAMTVIGGPHAKSYPVDCLRYFDLAVKECDRQLVADILTDQFDRPSVISSGRPLTEVPSVEERMPEIRASVFHKGRPARATMVGLLSSVGCPYTCDFCTDWNSTYQMLSPDRLEADLRYIAEHMPRVLVAYHDPNFAVHFDKTMDVIERLPRERRNWYAMESSLSLLMKPARLDRLRETKCGFAAPGVESWADYSNKTGAGAKQGRAKLDQITADFERLGRAVPGLQANFLFGLKGDRGPEPVELTKEFIRNSPQVWPTVNIPTPLGGTPLFAEMHREGRVLRAMPFALYFTQYYPVTTIEHYQPIEYFDHLVDLYATIGSLRMLTKRLMTPIHPYLRLLNSIRTLADRSDVRELIAVRDQLKADPHLLAFHEGKSAALPEFYHYRFEKRLGAYAELFPREERTPVLDQMPSC